MSEVREGFICPKCMQDMVTKEKLSSHFKTAHQEPESSEALTSLKDIFSKAKKKLLNEDRSSDGDSSRSSEVNKVQRRLASEKSACPPLQSQTDIVEQPEPGFIVVHSDMFRKARSYRLERYNMQINKLIIRLGKLLAPGTPIGNEKKRREFEQKIVEWADEDLVSLCPRCAESFTPFLGRRKHHCRLCGAVTCKDCSEFVDNCLAQQLLQGQIGSTIPVLRLRCCQDCFKLLLRKQRVILQGNSVDHLQEAYMRMRELMDRCAVLRNQYINVTDALLAGEGSLSHAQELRTSIMKLADKADSIAKKIGDSSKDSSLPPRNGQLRALIRAGASQFVKDILISMPQLPEPEQLERLAQQRREEARIKTENRISYMTIAMLAGGWTPSTDTYSCAEEDEDPLKQQIRNIKGFLEQARAANRVDEVTALAENLRQLEIAAGVRSC